MTTVLLKSADLLLPPTPTPLPGIVLVAGERRIGHEIKNILTALCGNLELLALEIPYSEIGLQLMDEVRRAIVRMDHVAKAAMESHKPSKILLNQTACESARLFARHCADNRISIATHLTQPVPIYASQASLDDIIANLIANAIQAMATTERKMLMICVDTIDHYSRLIVADTGCGMNDDTIHRLFHEQFTTKKDGNGIGLLAVFAGVAQLNGDIRVTSELGVGTTFELLFPRTLPEKVSP